MARKLENIIAHVLAVCENPSIRTTLIQTEDLRALCEAAEIPTGGMSHGSATTPSAFVLSCLEDKPNWKEPSFEYRAAHFLVGSGLVGGDLDGNIRALAAALKKQYDIGVEHGQRVTEFAPAES